MASRAWMNFRLAGLGLRPRRPSCSPKRTKLLAVGSRGPLSRQQPRASRPPAVAPEPAPALGVHTFYGVAEDAGLDVQGEAPPGILQHPRHQDRREIPRHLVHHGDVLLDGLRRQHIRVQPQSVPAPFGPVSVEQRASFRAARANSWPPALWPSSSSPKGHRRGRELPLALVGQAARLPAGPDHPPPWRPQCAVPGARTSAMGPGALPPEGSLPQL